MSKAFRELVGEDIRQKARERFIDLNLPKAGQDDVALYDHVSPRVIGVPEDGWSGCRNCLGPVCTCDREDGPSARLGKVFTNADDLIEELHRGRGDPENTDKSGGTRYSSGKPGLFWVAPLYGLRLVAKVWTSGAKKYAPLDWKEGQSFSTLLDCAWRHMLEVVERGPWAIDEGTPENPGTGAYHLACVAWNVLALLTFMALGRRDLDDVTPWMGVTATLAKEKGWTLDNPPGSETVINEETSDGPIPISILDQGVVRDVEISELFE